MPCYGSRLSLGFFLSRYTIIMIIVINLFHEQTPKGTLGLCCILTLPNQWLYHSSMDRYCCNILQGYMHGIFNFTRMKNVTDPFFSLIKACVHYFSFFFHQMRALMFFWKMFFVSSKKLFLFLKYWFFLHFCGSPFFPVSHRSRGWSKINPKVYSIVNCLNNNSIKHFA